MWVSYSSRCSVVSSLPSSGSTGGCRPGLLERAQGAASGASYSKSTCSSVLAMLARLGTRGPTSLAGQTFH